MIYKDDWSCPFFVWYGIVICFGVREIRRAVCYNTAINDFDSDFAELGKTLV